MTDVLMITGSTPRPTVLAAAVDKFQKLGACVHLVGNFKVAEIDADLGWAGVHKVPARASTDKHIQRKTDAMRFPERLWFHLEHDRAARAAVRSADLVVALDNRAVYSAWRISQFRRHPDVCFGIAAGLRALEKRRESGEGHLPEHVPGPITVATDGLRRRIRTLPADLLRNATGPLTLRSRVGARAWRAAVSAPGIPDTLRVTATEQVIQGMWLAGRQSGALVTARAAAEKLADPAIKARLLDEVASRVIKNGRTPDNLTEAVTAYLDLADAKLVSGDRPAAADALLHATKLAFHRVVHIDQLSSPLAADPAGFTAPFRKSTAASAVVRPKGRLTPAAAPPKDRPLRLLVATTSNANFLHLIRSHYEANPDVELRFLDMAEHPGMKRLNGATQRHVEYRLGGDPLFAHGVEQQLRPYLDWADTVFVDWCVAPAALFTVIDPGDTRIIVRLHSYEAFTRWPHVMDFSRVDDLVFVADHIRDLSLAAIPGLSGERTPRTHVIDNGMDLANFRRTKDPSTRFNLGLVGIGQVAKDPLWALQVLQLLRERDERYRLFVIGGEMGRPSNAAKAYARKLEKALKRLTEEGAVVQVGSTDDVPGALEDVGVILSTSVREGCHVGLMEGAASGAAPVVRDWPFFAGGEHGAGTLYPAEWVVGTVEEAVERVLSLTASDESWRNAGKMATEHALTTWDWPVVRLDFDRLLFGR
ncbi:MULTISPECIES: glycosyltransferase family 1 protein [Streptomyces]|uniref:glycosyltransferase n=1 Tax=Streptomyces TaxID=1883 RepID=UPI000D51D050|nr:MULTISPECIES: glycosyltransferase family 1 protein [Streptomyces]PVC64991.1 glycosyl transferase [Streptomyces sp. CS065A]